MKQAPIRTLIRNTPNPKRIVIKVGSALVTHNGAGLALDALAEWARQIALLRQNQHDIILVSSGAIAAGMQRLGWTTRPKSIHALQAAAATGQMGLIQAYENCFSQHDIKAAQILLTHEDLVDRTRYLNARSTLTTLLSLGVVPIINENDSVVTDEIKFGDNDTLAALVANLVEADALIILTDQAGLYTADPRHNPTATLVREHCADDPLLARMAGGAGSAIAKGGMITKIHAAARAARSGAHTIIASGNEPHVLLRIIEGEHLGTLLFATANPLTARKQWLADHLQLAGHLVLDKGAVEALKAGKSLLSVGVMAVQGEFERGACIACKTPEGEKIACGLTNYTSAEARRITGHTSSEIEGLLGYIDEPELIHRNNLVLL